MTKLKAIKELKKYDHSFLSPEGAKEIAKPFNFKPPLAIKEDTRSQFKGLTLYGINPKTKKEYQEGDTCEGIDAHRLANAIADHLGIDYPNFFGIGSQLRGTCEAMQKQLKKK